MENASKALLMAGGVLIGILILSLGVYLFVSFYNSTASMQNEMEEAAITNFNNQFLSYDGKEDLTIYDVATVVNLARENNEKFGLTGVGREPGNLYIAVYLNSNTNQKTGLENDTKFNIYKTNSNKTTEIDDVKYLHTSSNGTKKLLRYKCEVQVNKDTSVVDKIIFTDNQDYNY